MEITIDVTSPRYAKEQIADQLRAAILAGEITSKLPSVTDIARSANVAPGTAQRALNILRDEGLIIGRPGLGTFVKRG